METTDKTEPTLHHRAESYADSILPVSKFPEGVYHQRRAGMALCFKAGLKAERTSLRLIVEERIVNLSQSESIRSEAEINGLNWVLTLL